MKITKKEFKDIIKESLKELIQEGVFSDAVKEVVVESFSKGSSKGNIKNVSNKSPRSAEPDPVVRHRIAQMVGYDDGVDEYMSPASPDLVVNKNTNINVNTLRENLKNSGMSNDLAQILSDTAIHTLPKQMQAEGAGGYANMNREQVNESQMQQLAGPDGDTNRWASIAFANKKATSQ